jgi:serine/threonine-protein kinase HipA
MNKLFVLHNSNLVGELTEDDNEHFKFKYTSQWLENEKAFSLSLALKLDRCAYGHLETKSFFENLLPEGELREILESHSNLSIHSEFDFLKAFGVDCAGAFTISMDSRHAGALNRDKKEIKLTTLYKYLERKQSLTDVIVNQHGARFSLAGAQDKFPVICAQDKLYIPLGGEPTTHILKPCVRHHKDTEDTPYNEYFCMSLAKKVGLVVPSVTLIQGGFPLYLVERFDRKIKGGEVSRIHQQDFCQARGITSRKKYESDGGPSLASNYKLIEENSALPLLDLKQYLNWMWFNLFIGNNDCHSKNLSFICSEGGLRLSPFYDLLSTSIYKELSQQFTYKVGGQVYWYKLKRRHIDILATEIGVSSTILFSLGKEMVSRLKTNLPALVEDFTSQFVGIKTANRIEKEIHKRIDHISKGAFILS